MKIRYLAILAVLLAGCGPDLRIQKQQDQINTLVKQVQDLQVSLDQTRHDLHAISLDMASVVDLIGSMQTNNLRGNTNAFVVALDIADLQNERMYITNFLGARFMQKYHQPLPADFSDPAKYDQATGLPLEKNIR